MTSKLITSRLTKVLINHFVYYAPNSSLQKTIEQKTPKNIQSEISGVLVYPNPANNEITVAGENMINIKIYDELGRLLLSKTSNTNSQKIYIGDITQSVIVVEVTKNDGSISKHKVVILH